MKEKYKGKDMWQVMFELVDSQNISWSDSSIDTREGQNEWKNLLFCLTEELYEAANCLKIRPWVKTEYKVDYDHLYDELADSMWFFVQLLRKTGLSPSQAFEIFLRKCKVNEFRQNSNY